MKTKIKLILIKLNKKKKNENNLFKLIVQFFVVVEIIYNYQN